ncbi:unnamed protein product [Caenorhabditis angaria]|uniref:Putative hydroxypyruvate isomerase n=1 Tax=Caenorhabditis angaria TaxID=860376 RepID=A0A9P1IH37_9PELO|nr:unnamed protein product [Caenorhabditis angaria]
MSRLNRVSANLNMLFTNVPFLERYKLAAAAGFKLVEVSLPYQYDAKEMRAEADKYNLKHTLINAPPGNWEAGFRGQSALRSTVQQFQESIPIAISYAKILDCPRVHVMAGIPKTDEDIQHAKATFLDNLRFATEKLKENDILCLIEPINAITIPGYYLNNYDQAVEIIKTIDSPNLKIQFDYFHAQQICGQLSASLTKLRGHIGYIQVAQVPARGDCATPGEINYNFIFSELQKYDSELIVGLEYSDATPHFEWVPGMNLEF